LAPAGQRSEWLNEWTSELWYLVRRGDDRAATAFCAGAFRDALFVRSQSVEWSGLVRLSHPVVCLATLALAAVSAGLIMWSSQAVQASIWQQPILAHLLIVSGTLCFYPFLPNSLKFAAHGCRGWTFLGTKLALLIALTFFTSFNIVPIISHAPIQPQLAMVGYVVAFRWAARGQHRRCPTCLRLLTNPVRVGHSARTLLDWYGHEMVCSQGHGLLQQPELIKSSYCSSTWKAAASISSPR
jgi:hypothetical protein